MTDKHDGGPAFPIKGRGAFDLEIVQAEGMSLRDWFAATGPDELFKFHSLDDAAKLMGVDAPDPEDSAAIIAFAFALQAKMRFAYADAMIAARSEASK